MRNAIRKTLISLTALTALIGAGGAAQARTVHPAEATIVEPGLVQTVQYYGGYGPPGYYEDWRERAWRHQQWERRHWQEREWREHEWRERERYEHRRW